MIVFTVTQRVMKCSNKLLLTIFLMDEIVLFKIE